MKDVDFAQAAARQWAKDILERRKDLSARSWSVGAKAGNNAVQRLLDENYPHTTSARTLAKLAAFVGEKPPHLPDEKKTELRMMAPVILPNAESLAPMIETFLRLPDVWQMMQDQDAGELAQALAEHIPALLTSAYAGDRRPRRPASRSSRPEARP